MREQKVGNTGVGTILLKEGRLYILAIGWRILEWMTRMMQDVDEALRLG